MTPEQIRRELARIGRMLGRWQAQWRASLAAAAVLAALGLFAAMDLALRYGRGGRVFVWTLLVAGAAAGLAAVALALKKHRDAPAVAARIERGFPELDNHLINYVQFASLPLKNSLITAYIKDGAPDLARLDIAAMKNRRAHRRAFFALLAAAALMTVPSLWAGQAWRNALLRIVNPFSDRSPATLARILEVRPGDRAVLSGSAIALECLASGRRGQEILLDLWPADDQRSVIALGVFEGAGIETNVYRLPRLTTDLRYRFRAGDDRSRIYTIRAVPSLAFDRVEMEAIPPAYTGLGPETADATRETVNVPEGSELTLRVEANRPLVEAVLHIGDHREMALTSLENGGFGGRITAAAGTALRLEAADADGFKVAAVPRINVIPDRPPSLRVVYPAGRTSLGPGARPRITFEADDDYGLAHIVLEATEPDARPDSPGWPVAEWNPGGQRHFTASWTGEDTPAAGIPLVYRLTASDNRPDEPNRAMSALIVFDVAGTMDAVKKEKEALAAGRDSFSAMVEAQRKALRGAEALYETISGSRPEQWREIGVMQGEVRRIAGALLANPARPLASLAETVRGMFHGPMTEALDLLGRVMTLEGAPRNTAAAQAIALQKRILEALTRMESQLDALLSGRDIAGMIALLDALMRNQSRLIQAAETVLAEERPPERSLANRQDRLANDAFAFLRLCREEAGVFEANHKEFAGVLVKVADYFERHQAAPLMLIAAEFLENAKADQALIAQRRALEIMAACMEMLNAWRAEAAIDKMELLRETVDAAKQDVDKMIDIQGQVVESIRQVQRMRDLSDKDMDHLGDELAELREKMKDKLLQLADDLHIFPELPVGNDLVMDVFQVFEAVEQKEGSETGEVTEINIGKNEDKSMEILEALEQFRERLDNMEFWLPAEPNRFKVEAESFDREEFPNQIPIVPMAGEMEDLIGDLLEKLDQGQDTDDTATNIGQPDIESGWEVTEGQITTYSAKGVSGNEEPDHKEQDGRSIIGREGMSEGETAAGSGTINEGDDDIEERMTQDPAQSGQVEEMGDAEAKATGGGKQSGHADELGMPGHGPRRDSEEDDDSELGWEALLRRDAEALYARASLSHLRTGSLDEAVRHLRQAEEAVRDGRPIQQVHEHRRRAAAALRNAITELGPGIPSEALALDYSPPHIEDKIVGSAGEAPAIYRDLVAEYFKALSRSP